MLPDRDGLGAGLARTVASGSGCAPLMAANRDRLRTATWAAPAVLGHGTTPSDEVERVGKLNAALALFLAQSSESCQGSSQRVR